MKCEICFRGCELKEGQTGFCKARKNIGGENVPAAYGKIVSAALDPIEKKPLAYFYPGSWILSVGSYGCNLACPFCQNHEISQVNLEREAADYSPAELVQAAADLKERGNIGIAFTYNEPLINWEYIRDTFALAKENGLKTVLVTNGTANPDILKVLLPLTDALNIDLKGFDQSYYDWLQGDLESVKCTIAMAAPLCHVELTMLVVPGRNDSPEEMEEMAKWIASIDPDIPLHLTRYFPRWKEKAQPTSLQSLQTLQKTAVQYISRVRLGNV